MNLTVDCENVSKENVHREEKLDIIERVSPLDKLLKLSKSFKTGVDNNILKFKEEKMAMMNEISGMSCTIIPNTIPDETFKHCEEQPHQKLEENSSKLFVRENHKSFKSSERKLKDEQNSLEVKNNENILKPNQNNEECCIPCIQYNNEKTNYIKKIFDLENKYRYWMDKYNELHNKYSQLEVKSIQIEKENCGYQMEIARIQIVENENLRLNQTIDKSNHVRKELESALESCHKVVDKYQTDVDIARNKVKEAIELVEKTYSEKDRIVEDLNKSNEELVRLEMALKNLVHESSEKVNLEVEKIKTLYKNKLHETNMKIEVLCSEKLIECKKRLQISREYEKLNKKYTLIKQKSMNEPDVYSKKEAFLVKQIEEYEVTLANLTSNVKNLKETNMKLKERRRCSDDNFEMRNIQINELIKHIEAHKQIVDMWKKATHDMFERFKYKINQLKQHCNKLNKKNIKLEQIINNSKPNYLALKKKRKLQKTNKLSDHLSMSIST